MKAMWLCSRLCFSFFNVKCPGVAKMCSFERFPLIFCSLTFENRLTTCKEGCSNDNVALMVLKMQVSFEQTWWFLNCFSIFIPAGREIQEHRWHRFHQPYPGEKKDGIRSLLYSTPERALKKLPRKQDFHFLTGPSTLVDFSFLNFERKSRMPALNLYR